MSLPLQCNQASDFSDVVLGSFLEIWSPSYCHTLVHSLDLQSAHTHAIPPSSLEASPASPSNTPCMSNSHALCLQLLHFGLPFQFLILVIITFQLLRQL